MATTPTPATEAPAAAAARPVSKKRKSVRHLASGPGILASHLLKTDLTRDCNLYALVKCAKMQTKVEDDAEVLADLALSEYSEEDEYVDMEVARARTLQKNIRYYRKTLKRQSVALKATLDANTSCQLMAVLLESLPIPKEVCALILDYALNVHSEGPDKSDDEDDDDGVSCHAKVPRFAAKKSVTLAHFFAKKQVASISANPK